MPRVLACSLAAIACLTAGSLAIAARCATGYDSRACLEQIKRLDRELKKLYEGEEELLRTHLREYEPEYRDEAIATIREANAAFMKYQDSSCYARFLRDGMSLKDAGVLADECKVTWRLRHVTDIKRKLSRK